MGQFVLPAVILGIGVLGYWLLGGQKSTTQKPDRMPALNVSMRGSPVFVTFGSNRISAQVPWSDNFKAVRNNGGGKFGSKSGGSGGLGAGKGASDGTGGYEYFQDMMFHFGIMDQPSMIRQAWIGGDNVKASDVAAITAGGSTTIQAVFPPETKDPNANVATISFSEAFYAPGYNTDDPSLESWDYFEEQEGFLCAFPSNAWIGFKQLDLGSSSAIPQLACELVPINLSVGPAPSFEQSIQLSRTGGSTIAAIGTNYAFMSDAAGNRWLILEGAVSGYQLYSPDTDTLVNITNAAYVSAVAGLTGKDASSWTIGPGVWPVPGTKYFLMTRASGGAGNVVGILFQVNPDGTYEEAGGFQSTLDGIGLAWWPTDADALTYTEGNLLVAGEFTSGSIGGRNYGIQKFPIQSMIDTLYVVNLTSYNAFGQFLFQDQTTSNWRTFVNGQTVLDNTSVYVQISQKNLIDIAAETPGVNNIVDALVAASVTEPGFYKFTYTGTVGTAPTISTIFTTQFADDGKNFSGTVTDSQFDAYRAPNVATATSGDILLSFVRTYTDENTTVRAQIYDNSTGMWLTDVTAANLFDPTLVGMTTSTSPELVQIYYNTTDGSYSYAWFGGSSFNRGYVFGGALSPAGAADVTPAYIIYRILTSEVFGFATSALFGYVVTPDRINTARYNAAVQWCVDQGITLSVTYTNQSQLLDVLNELLSLYQGFLVDDAGVITFGIVNGTDAPVRTLDNSHFVIDKGKPPVKTTKAAQEDGYNDIQFNYLDRQIAYNQNQVEVFDEVDMDFNGPRIKTYQPTFVMAGSVATQIATRALWQNLSGNDQYAFDLGWKDADINPGTLVTLVDSFDPTLSFGVRARILTRKQASRGRYQCTAVREFPTILTAKGQFTDTATINPGWGSIVEDVSAPYMQTAYELPQEFQGSKAQVYFGYAQASNIMGAQLYISTDGGASFPLVQDVKPFIISGRLAQSLEHGNKTTVDNGVEFYIFTASNFSVATPTFTNCFDLDDITPSLRAAGAGTMIVGSEAMAFETLTLLGTNHYRAEKVYRGWGGSPVGAHSSGAYFHQHASGIFAVEISKDKIGTQWQYKIAPYNFVGDVMDISSITASSYQIIGYYWLPREQPRTQVFVESAVNWSANSPLLGKHIVNVVSGGCDVAFGWPAASNTDGFGAGGFGAGGFGHFEPDTTGVTLPDYRVEVQSLNGVTVRSTVVYTGWFNYSMTENIADFGSFAQQIGIKITPFNGTGDGPISDTTSVGMIW